MNVARPLVAAAPRLLVRLLASYSLFATRGVRFPRKFLRLDRRSFRRTPRRRTDRIRQDKTGFSADFYGTTGLYRLPDLAPGIYSVTVRRTDFGPPSLRMYFRD